MQRRPGRRAGYAETDGVWFRRLGNGMTKQRNRDLDGLRGLAALSVAIGHSASFSGGTGIALRMTPSTVKDGSWTDVIFRALHIVFHADAAVVVFFVLSGLVLARSLRNQPETNALSFTIRRIFRLFPVSIAAAIITGALLPTATWEQIVGAALLYDTKLNAVLWSLQIEVAGSALIFALWFARRINVLLFIVLCAATFAMARYYPRPVFVFMPAFVLGSVIDDLPKFKWRAALLPLSILSLMTADFFLGVTFTTRWLQIFGSFGLVAYFAQNSSILTRNPVSHFLGLVSYPFYLLHLAGALIAIKLGLSQFTLSPIPLFVAHAVASITIALPISWAVHTVIENPGIRLGVWLSGSIRPVAAPA